MKNLTIIFSLFLSFNITASDKYRIGDKLYIWAKSGINLRVGPGTQFGIIAKLGFGSTVYIIDKPNRKYNIACVSETDSTYYYEDVAPLILYGNWIKVASTNGEEGYIIDQYALSIQPYENDINQVHVLNLRLIDIDTIYKSPIIYDGSGLNLTVSKTYENDINIIDNEGGVWGETTITFPNLSIEEVLIIIGSSMYTLEGFKVLRNWKEELLLSDGELCHLELKVIKGTVVLNEFCSC
jgi:hypothetical protein